MKIVRTTLHFVIAVIVTFLLASVAGTQLVLADILSFGLPVTLADRLSATLHDIFGLLTMLPLLIAVTFLIAFIFAEIINQFLVGKRVFWYMLAGLTSLPFAMMLIKSLMGATVFAAARSSLGMLLLALSGLAGGWLFARLTQKRPAS